MLTSFLCLHYNLPISVEVFPYRNIQRKVRGNFDRSPQNAESAAVIAQVSSQAQEKVDPDAELIAALEEIDTDAFLRSIYEIRDSFVFAWPRRDGTPGACERGPGESCIHRDGFGGLRLAGVEPEPELEREAA